MDILKMCFYCQQVSSFHISLRRPVSFVIHGRLTYARVKPIIDPLLPQEQAGFRRGRSTVDQVTLLT